MFDCHWQPEQQSVFSCVVPNVQDLDLQHDSTRSAEHKQNVDIHKSDRLTSQPVKGWATY